MKWRLWTSSFLSQRVLLLVVGLGIILVCTPRVQGSQMRQPDMVWFAIAAKCSDDASFLAAARASHADEVTIAGALVGRWVPMTPDVAKEAAATDLVTRSRADGSTELLIHVSVDDIHDDDIACVWKELGPDGCSQVLVFGLHSAGSRRMLQLTRNNKGRRVAQVVRGSAVAIPVIRSLVTEQVVLTRQPSKESEEALLAAFSAAPRDKAAEEIRQSLRTSSSPHNVWSAVAILAIVAVVLVGLLVRRPEDLRVLWCCLWAALVAAPAATLIATVHSGSSLVEEGVYVATQRVSVRACGLALVVAGAATGGWLLGVTTWWLGALMIRCIMPSKRRA